ncbi:SUMO-targeted ubiquitin ligase complex subunit SLX8 KNAG_0C03410 [Huiozyma naganishii CBS 8797]|uniref:RING-type domain-containing protein n=1 Tax=Huiozyma naganishii (strain ATCC MYA-139 / BCRC 22969 / CBS 8797 / KCTC 17520 / NBRC 10181 / NCYC 3082 / Yp74L-3) TaxID=1071383 RepID=J7RIU3_HUIN7|nr:hypothetical protein KNAG_0C03410 [Kazachstania naganishii CBS 8797]CCK69448.1 hypothetical protein KNAG_0C03410 [Kazachstania naganishii CBS 8797]
MDSSDEDFIPRKRARLVREGALNDDSEASESSTDLGTNDDVPIYQESGSDSESVEVLEERDVDVENFNLDEAFKTTNGNGNGSADSPNAVQEPPMIDLDAEAQQQVVEIPDEDEDARNKDGDVGNDDVTRELRETQQNQKPPQSYKPLREYKCPICFDPPDVAMAAPCGHVFCCECLFNMVNNSRNRGNFGLCALCRSKVDFKRCKMIIVRKNKVSKPV